MEGKRELDGYESPVELINTSPPVTPLAGTSNIPFEIMESQHGLVENESLVELVCTYETVMPPADSPNVTFEAMDGQHELEETEGLVEFVYTPRTIIPLADTPNVAFEAMEGQHVLEEAESLMQLVYTSQAVTPLAGTNNIIFESIECQYGLLENESPASSMNTPQSAMPLTDLRNFSVQLIHSSNGNEALINCGLFDHDYALLSPTSSDRSSSSASEDILFDMTQHLEQHLREGEEIIEERGLDVNSEAYYVDQHTEGAYAITEVQNFLFNGEEWDDASGVQHFQNNLGQGFDARDEIIMEQGIEVDATEDMNYLQQCLERGENGNGVQDAESNGEPHHFEEVEVDSSIINEETNGNSEAREFFEYLGLRRN